MKRLARIEQFVHVIWPYGLVIWLLLLATWLKIEMPLLGRDTPFLMYFFVISVAALVAGWRAGVLTTVVAALLALYFFLQPSKFDLNVANALKLTLFGLEGVLISLIVERERRSRIRLMRSLDELERTRERLAESNERVTHLLAEVMDKSIDRAPRKGRQ